MKQNNTYIYNNISPFKLNLKDFELVINEVQKRNPDIKFIIQESNRQNSKSLYVFINYNGTSNLFRISDHKCNGKVRQVIVKNKTTIGAVCNQLQNTIKHLKIKHLYKLLEKINEEKL